MRCLEPPRLLGSFVSAHEIPFPGNGDFGSKRRSSNPQLLSGKTGGPRRRKVAAHQDFRSTTTTLSRRSRSSGTTTAKPDGHTRRKRRSATVFTSNEMPSLTSTRILSLQPSRHFCRSLMVVDAQCPVPRCSPADTYRGLSGVWHRDDAGRVAASGASRKREGRQIGFFHFHRHRAGSG